jgi:hypothetical protein
MKKTPRKMVPGCKGRQTSQSMNGSGDLDESD